MKQKDMLLIGAIVIVAGIASLVVSKMIFATPSNRQQQVEVVDPISTTFSTPNTNYFNINSVDPTQNIQIGSSNNPTPFSGDTQQ